ncbi:MAG: hypothetical protein VXY93_17735, partial [Pseudomonadota bacterium]|nr:hypothetical protein [Pseudomonadota bacterium]
VTNVDSVGLLTARSGIRVTGGVIEAQAGENKIPSLYANMGALPSAGSYHGMFAHVHATGRGYFAHAGAWLELVNKELNGVVGTGTENYNVGVITATAIDLNGDIDVDGHTNLDNVSITGVTTFTGNISGIATFQDIDVDGHTNLDNVSVAGITTFDNDVAIGRSMYHVNDVDTSIGFPTNGTVRISANNLNIAEFTALGTPSATFNTKINATGGT